MKGKKKKAANKRSVKKPDRFKAKLTRPHSSKKGTRGHDRRPDTRLTDPELFETDQGC